jgi:hypothetical protein
MVMGKAPLSSHDFAGWGVPIEGESKEPQTENGMPAVFMRKMTALFMYSVSRVDSCFLRFAPFFFLLVKGATRRAVCHVLRRKWETKHALYVASAERKALRRSDFVLRMELMEEDEFIGKRTRHFREFKVSGGLTLRALADKVLVPVFGYTSTIHQKLPLAQLLCLRCNFGFSFFFFFLLFLRELG